MQTNKKKYFVLRCESADYPARLEYYDNEKKFKAHQEPKRSISLKACFNINRRIDLKPKYVVALYTRDDCFCIVLESEEERESWLKALWALQDGDDVTDGETPKPVFGKKNFSLLKNLVLVYSSSKNRRSLLLTWK